MSQSQTVIDMEEMVDQALAAKGICKKFHDGVRERHVLRNVDLTIGRGKFIALTGPSGSGKTTLLNILGAMELPDTGQVIIDGRDITGFSEKDLVRVRNEKIGMVFQFFHLLDQVPVIDNIELPMHLAGGQPRKIREHAMKLLEKIGMSHMAGREPSSLSGGEKQRVAIVRALANSPSIVLADEPTGNLDEKTGREIIDLMVNLTIGNGASLLVVTHNREVASYADEVFELSGGELLLQ